MIFGFQREFEYEIFLFLQSMFFRKSKIISHQSSSSPTELQFDSDDIRKYQAIDIANELTLINRNFLLRIKPEELFNFAFLSTEKVKLKF